MQSIIRYIYDRFIPHYVTENVVYVLQNGRYYAICPLRMAGNSEYDAVGKVSYFCLFGHAILKKQIDKPTVIKGVKC